MLIGHGMKHLLDRYLIIMIFLNKWSNSQGIQYCFSDLSNDRQNATVVPEHLR